MHGWLLEEQKKGTGMSAAFCGGGRTVWMITSYPTCMNTYLAGAMNELKRAHARHLPSPTAVESAVRGEWSGTLPQGRWILRKNDGTSFDVETGNF